MNVLDRIANQSRAVGYSPAHKVLFALGLLFVVIGFDKIPVSIAAFLIVTLFTVGWARVSAATWFKIMLAQSTFLGLSLIALLFTTTASQPADALWGVAMWPGWVGVTESGLWFLGELFLRSVAAVACLNFLAVTTPMHDLIRLAQRYKAPELLIDLILLTYRFIWSLYETLQSMRTAQQSRLGYSSFKVGLRSAAQLGARLFIRTYQRMDALNTSWEARLGGTSMPIWHTRTHQAAYSLLVTLAGMIVLAALI